MCLGHMLSYVHIFSWKLFVVKQIISIVIWQIWNLLLLKPRHLVIFFAIQFYLVCLLYRFKLLEFCLQLIFDQHWQSWEDCICGVGNPWNSRRSHRLLSRRGNLQAMSEDCRASLGPRSWPQWRRESSRIRRTAEDVHQRWNTDKLKHIAIYVMTSSRFCILRFCVWWFYKLVFRCI